MEAVLSEYSKDIVATAAVVSYLIFLRARYAMFGTELSNGAALCDAMPGTELGYGATVRYAMSDTEMS
eukprot:1417851-Rhodomonas_salina.2